MYEREVAEVTIPIHSSQIGPFLSNPQQSNGVFVQIASSPNVRGENGQKR